MRMGARLTAFCLALAMAIVAGLVVPSSATAAAYRYWTYWQSSAGGWNFATAGPATTLPADGSIEGWRFAITSAAGTSADEPRTAATFGEICDGTPAVSGSKRVGLVVDFGDPAAAPDGEIPPALITTCVVADADATGYEILRSVVEVRTDDVGLVCGLASYPSVACPEVVDSPVSAGATPRTAPEATVAPTVAAAADSEESPASIAQVLGLAGLVAALVIAAIVVSRRRRT